MAECLDRHEAGRRAVLLAHLANCHRSSDKDPIAYPWEYDPYAPKPEPPRIGQLWDAMERAGIDEMEVG